MSASCIRRTITAALMVSSMTTLAFADPPPAAQIKPRQDKLRDMGGALKAITDEIKNRILIVA